MIMLFSAGDVHPVAGNTVLFIMREKKMNSLSSVLAFAPPSPAVSEAYLLAKLSFYTDSADVADDLKNRLAGIVVIDTRAEAHYLRGHIPGAVSFPHRLMSEETTRHLDRNMVYVTYCDGIGCNGSTQGAYKLAKLGFRVKELIGGLDFWIRDQHPLAEGEAIGTYPADLNIEDCGCN